ncbi:phosphate acyltransferase PlsX [Ureaplasma ceti]|uniref:Phosphate acyltransferase n=1 Tax=Ureaplasma ceti TaxID=3119530 RepID=A0ABP9UC32_9BACT
MRLGVDVMGFENDISQAIKACRTFQKKYKDVQICLVGDENQIQPHLLANDEFEIVHTDQFVTQEDTILSARRKPKSSMQVLANLLKEDKVDGLLSAGSTPIFVFTMYSTIGMLPGVDKPGFMPTIPTSDGQAFNLLDVGASINVEPLDLVRFAIMGNAFAKQRVKEPVIGLLNIGTEEHKGHKYLQETSQLLRKTNLNYKGFVESKELLNRVADVVVTDGFTGNITLKACEGAAKAVSNIFKTEYKKPKNILATLFSLGIIKKATRTFDYKDHAGAFVLGLNKICVKTHGSADERQFYSSLRMLYDCLKNNVLENIKADLNAFNETLNLVSDDVHN